MTMVAFFKKKIKIKEIEIDRNTRSSYSKSLISYLSLVGSAVKKEVMDDYIEHGRSLFSSNYSQNQ